MKKLPQDYAPSSMRPWVRALIEALKTFDADIANLKALVTSSSLGVGTSNIINNAQKSNAKLANVGDGFTVPIVWSATGTIALPTINTPVSLVVTLPVGLFSDGPLVTVTRFNGSASTGLSFSTVSSTSSAVTISAVAAFVTTPTFAMIAVQN